MPFVLPPGVAEGSQQSIYLRSVYQSEQAAQTAAGPDANWSKLTAEAGTNIHQVFSGSGRVYDISATNAQAANLYIKLYDLNRAPVLTSDAPMRTEVLFGLDNLTRMLSGLTFSNGLWFAITAAIEAHDDTPIEAGAVMAINITYRLGG